jgi:WD40 repeat protein
LSRLFISHSSSNDDWAIALTDWLVREGWARPDDVFLDLDPECGIAAGQRWVHALEEAATRCEAVLFLVSEAWLTSKWCLDEYQLANRLNKKLFALLIDDIALDRLPGGLTGQWQIVRLKGDPAARFLTVHPLTQRQLPVHIAEAALTSLRRGLAKAGLGATTFELQRDQSGPFGWRAPYRGLEALEPEDAAVFFGRNADIVRGIDMLRGLAARMPPRVLVILGASGAGKSSFLRAGLWPRLLRDDGQWLPLRTIRAGRGGAIEGSEGLLSTLEDVHRRFGMQATRADLRDRWTTPDNFVALLGELRQAAAKRVLISEPPYPLPILCLDQAEEVFATSAAAESDKFLTLARAAVDADAALLLVSIRSDSYGAMQGAKVLVGIDQVLLSLGPVPNGEIAHIIREPAEVLRRKTGPAAPLFDAAVIERLQEEIEGEADALPLLAFVLQRLMREHYGLPVIGIAELEHTGGVAAAIESAADAALNDVGIGRDRAVQREMLRRLFIPRLARIDRDSRAPQRRVAKQSELPSDLLPLAHALTQRRLLVVKAAAPVEAQAPGGTAAADGATLEVAHEALLRRWPTLAELLGEDRDALLLLDGVLSAAADWDKAEAARRSDFLTHRGSRLADARALTARGPDWQRESAPAQFYLAACVARENEEREIKETALRREQAQVARARKLQKRTGWALTAVFVAVIAALVAAFWQSHQTSKREASVFASAGATASRQGFCDHALRMVVAGLPPAKGRSPLTFISRELEGDLSLFASSRGCYFQLALQGHTYVVNSAVFSPDGERVVTASGDHTARLWDAKTGAALATLAGHSGTVWSATFSLDGTRVVTASDDHTARLWDAKTGAALATLAGHTGQVFSAAFSPDGTRVVTASGDMTARLWDSETGAAVATLEGHKLTVLSAAFSPDGKRVGTASGDKTARLWDTKTGTALSTLVGHTDWVKSATFSPDGTRVVTASWDHTARLWDAKTGTMLATLAGHTNQVQSAAFSPDGTRIITESRDNTARLWDAKTGAALATLAGHMNQVNSAVFSPDSARVVTAGDNTARLWDTKTGIALATLVGHTSIVLSAAFSPDGTRIVTASSDHTSRLWQAKTGIELATLSGHTAWVHSTAFSPDGARVITASWDNTARLWDAKTGATFAILKGHTDVVNTAMFSPDGTRVITASWDNTARLWDAKTGAALSVLSGHIGMVHSAAFSPDGTRILTTSQTARLWDSKTGAALATLAEDTGAVLSATFSPDGARVVTASWDHTARLWDAKTGTMLATLAGHMDQVNSGVFSPDGTRVLTASGDNTARVWDAKTGIALAILRGHTDGVVSAMFSPDGASIVTASKDETARLWDAKTGAALATLAGHTNSVNTAVFSPDGTRVLTASGDNTARVWDAKTGSALATLAGHTDVVDSAAFNPDGTRVVTGSEDNTARIWHLDPLVLMPADQRQGYVCRDRLIGAQSFTDAEMQDPILRGREDLRNPCHRVGPLSPTYYWRAAESLVAAARKAFALH